MCSTCWEEHGSPADWTPQTARFIELVGTLYGELGHSTGGPLHVVLDDWNLDGPIEPYYSLGDSRKTREVCDEIVAILNDWTPTERYAAMAHLDGFVQRPTEAPADPG